MIEAANLHAEGFVAMQDDFARRRACSNRNSLLKPVEQWHQRGRLFSSCSTGL